MALHMYFGNRASSSSILEMVSAALQNRKFPPSSHFLLYWKMKMNVSNGRSTRRKIKKKIKWWNDNGDGTCVLHGSGGWSRGPLEHFDRFSMRHLLLDRFGRVASLIIRFFVHWKYFKNWGWLPKNQSINTVPNVLIYVLNFFNDLSVLPTYFFRKSLTWILTVIRDTTGVDIEIFRILLSSCHKHRLLRRTLFSNWKWRNSEKNFMRQAGMISLLPFSFPCLKIIFKTSKIPMLLMGLQHIWCNFLINTIDFGNSWARVKIQILHTYPLFVLFDLIFIIKMLA